MFYNLQLQGNGIQFNSMCKMNKCDIPSVMLAMRHFLFLFRSGNSIQIVQERIEVAAMQLARAHNGQNKNEMPTRQL